MIDRVFDEVDRYWHQRINKKVYIIVDHSDHVTSNLYATRKEALAVVQGIRQGTIKIVTQP
jgi:hypothetical protein